MMSFWVADADQITDVTELLLSESLTETLSAANRAYNRLSAI